MVRIHSIARALVFAGAIEAAVAAFSGAGYTLNFPDQLNGAIDITHVRTTLVLPKAPQPAADVLALWPGVQSKSGADGKVGLTQSIAAAFGHPSHPKPDGCNGTAGQWCAFTYQFVNQPGASFQGPTVAVNAGAHLVIDYHKDGNAYHQTITLNGRVISSLKRDNYGPGYTFYTAVECHSPFNHDVPAHQYLDTTITLSGQHPNFKNTLRMSQADATPLTTPDGGKTWKIARINVHKSHCDATNGKDVTSGMSGWPN